MASLCHRHFFQCVPERDGPQALQGKAACLLSQTCPHCVPKATACCHVNPRVDVNSPSSRPWAEPFCPEHSALIHVEESPHHRRGSKSQGTRTFFQGHLRNPCRKRNSPGRWGLSPSNPGSAPRDSHTPEARPGPPPTQVHLLGDGRLVCRRRFWKRGFPPTGSKMAPRRAMSLVSRLCKLEQDSVHQKSGGFMAGPSLIKLFT